MTVTTGGPALGVDGGGAIVAATVLGRGPVAVVYAGRLAATGAEVAVKVFPDRFDRDTATRLERERRALAGVASVPSILAVESVGEYAGDRSSVVTQLCAGSLAGMLTRGALPVSEVLAVGAAVAGALAAAHEAGVVHGGVTPHNVLFRRSGEPVLGDFGLALRERFARDPMHALEYTAPETLRDDARTTASDLYGLGAVLYAMLTGAPPFPRRTGQAPGERILRVLRDPVPPIQSIPGELSELVSLLLAKDATARPADAARVAAWFDHVRGRSTAVPPALNPLAPPAAHPDMDFDSFAGRPETGPPQHFPAAPPLPLAPLQPSVQPPITPPAITQPSATEPANPSPAIIQPPSTPPAAAPQPVTHPLDAQPASNQAAFGQPSQAAITQPSATEPAAAASPSQPSAPWPSIGQPAANPPASDHASVVQPAPTHSTAPGSQAPTAPPSPTHSAANPPANDQTLFAQPAPSQPANDQPSNDQPSFAQPAPTQPSTSTPPGSAPSASTPLGSTPFAQPPGSQAAIGQFPPPHGPGASSVRPPSVHGPGRTLVYSVSGQETVRKSPRWRLPAGIGVLLVAAGVAAVVLISEDDGGGSPAAQQNPAPTTTSAPKTTTAPDIGLEVTKVEDLGDRVELTWSAEGDLDFSVVVAGEKIKTMVLVANRQREMTVPVDPGRKYCFQIRATDIREIYTSEPVPIRGARCAL